MGNPNVHNHKRCPLFFAGHAGGALKGNIHIKAPDGTPMANAMLVGAADARARNRDASATARGALDLNAVARHADTGTEGTRCSRCAGTQGDGDARGARRCARSLGAPAVLVALVALLGALARRPRQRRSPTPRCAGDAGGGPRAAQGGRGRQRRAGRRHDRAALGGDARRRRARGDAALRRRERRATTRLGGYTPLHLAAQAGAAAVIARLVAGGADVDAPTATGATPLMLAAASGSADAVRRCSSRRPTPTRSEAANGETALMFAAAARSRRRRARCCSAPWRRRRDRTSKVVDLRGRDARRKTSCRGRSATRRTRRAASGERRRRGRPPPPRRAAGAAAGVPGVTRAFTYNELIGKQGGLTRAAFRRAAGRVRTVRGAGRRRAPTSTRRAPAIATSPLLIAAINGQFDIATYLLDARRRTRTRRATPA